MSMRDWVQYYEGTDRSRLLNVISLEFSHTKLENYVESPSLVSTCIYVTSCWNSMYIHRILPEISHILWTICNYKILTMNVCTSMSEWKTEKWLEKNIILQCFNGLFLITKAKLLHMVFIWIEKMKFMKEFLWKSCESSLHINICEIFV